MKRHFLRCLFWALLLTGAVVRLDAAPDQPNMRAALELLQAAKKSDQPMPMLQAAKQRLKGASKNKGGERLEAIEYVNEAMAMAKAGDKDKMEQKVNAAIANIHSGMGKAR